MNLNGMRKLSLQTLLLSVFASLIISCDVRKSQDEPEIPTPVTNPTPTTDGAVPPPATTLVTDNTERQTSPKACSESFEHGATRSVTLYKKEFAPVGGRCESFESQETCDQGQIVTKDEGSTSCELTTVKSLAIVSPKTSLEINQSLALSLEAIDNRGGKITLENSKVKWSSSNDFVKVSSTGVVSGTIGVKNVVITARFEKLSAQVKLNVLGKSCGETLDGESLSIKRFQSEKVAFNASCQTIETRASCENGVFTYADESFETCSVASLTKLEASPASLFLNQGETARVQLFVHDEIGTRVEIPSEDAKWELPKGVLESVGRLTASEVLNTPVEVMITAGELSTKVIVKSPERKPELLSFRTNSLTLKVGDEKTLEFNSTLPVEASALNWATSDATLVSVENGKITALKAGSKATITASLDGKTIEMNVNVEATIEWTLSPVIYVATQNENVHPLTQDKPSLLPAYVLTVASDDKPTLSNTTEGCKFELRLSRQKWELDVEIDETLSVIPNRCEADLALESRAGQKLQQKISIPVDYAVITVKESLPKTLEGQEGVEVARVSYKMSSSYSVQSATIKSLATSSFGSCEWSLVENDKAYAVVAQRPSNETCVAQVVLKFLDANDNLVLTINELVIASDARPIADICQNPANEAEKATLSAIRQEMSPSLSCDKFSDLVRSKNFGMIASNRNFPLALDNQKLTDLKPLARFLGLSELSLAANRELSDISPLKDLALLKLLNLKFTAVKDFSPIFGHRRMSDLRLPIGAALGCSDAILNPELNKICQD